MVYGKDWEAKDHKSAVASVIKQSKGFKLTEAKIVEITPNSDKVGAKTTYTGEACLHSVLKKGKKWSNCKPQRLPHVSTVSAAKKADVYNGWMHWQLTMRPRLSMTRSSRTLTTMPAPQMKRTNCSMIVCVKFESLYNKMLIKMLNL